MDLEVQKYAVMITTVVFYTPGTMYIYTFVCKYTAVLLINGLVLVLLNKFY